MRIKSILIGTGGGHLPTSPRRVKLWVNRVGGISLDEANEVPPEQEFELMQGEGRGATVRGTSGSKKMAVELTSLLDRNIQ